MKHKIGFNRLGRKPAHRKALHRNMVTSLFKHERIQTTKAKAREIRRTAEKMITRAKVDSVHNRRMVARDIKDKAILAKLFVDIAPRFKSRPGGYTRMLKIGQRQGDAAEMVLLELVQEELEEAPKAKKSGRKTEKKNETKSGDSKAKSASTKKSASAEAKKAAEGESSGSAAADDEASTDEATQDGADAAAEETSDDQPAGESLDATTETPDDDTKE